ncbi:DUF7289 family protein [Halapricum desulfuricans]|uniref:Putative pilin/flagellin n=1 Tax=Halapricum desulfuricans TaxID=2841257 RepID=A0A897NAX5_9EURY|nr:hypothetical protein [Halapricum desulfuricans]QSG09551.1 putative pilin/flagellin [Halapricum desulfuricans]
MTRRTADRRATTEQDRNTGERGMSEVLGFALVFALVVSTTVLVAVVGFDELENTRDQEELNNAERAFDVLADNMADIHADGAPSRATEINLESAQLEVGDPVTFNVTGVNQTGASFVNEFTSEPIVYASGDTKIVYSGGAVFRTTGDGSILITEPPFLIGSRDIVLPVVQLRHRGDTASTSGTTVRVRAEERDRRPVGEFRRTPSSFDKVIINITSPRSDLWADYLSSRDSITDCQQTGTDNVRCRIDDPDTVHVSGNLIIYAFET